MGDKPWWPSAVFSYRGGLSCRAVKRTFGKDPSACLRSHKDPRDGAIKTLLSTSQFRDTKQKGSSTWIIVFV
jgi:hypothetical protein